MTRQEISKTEAITKVEKKKYAMENWKGHEVEEGSWENTERKNPLKCTIDGTHIVGSKYGRIGTLKAYPSQSR